MIAWERKEPKFGDLYPHRIVAVDHDAFRAYATDMDLFCAETFGLGGRLPDIGSRWFSQRDEGIFAFKSEVDLIVFMVAFRG